MVVLPSRPERYAEFLAALGDRAAADPELSEPFVFVNAWNEWSEGAYLEPDRRWGTAWLEAVRSAVEGHGRSFAAPVLPAA